MSLSGRVNSNPGWVAAGVGLVGVLLGGAAVALGVRYRPPRADIVAPSVVEPPDAATAPVAAPPRLHRAEATDLADAIAQTRDAVVNLGTAQTLGAGVIVDESGVVLTNHHVIADALQAPPALLSALRSQSRRPTVTARFEDGRELQATVLVADREEDLAILRLVPTRDGERFAAVELGRSAELRVGQDVFAIGNPFGLSHTVSRGIVSALDRTGILQKPELPLIQLDASINVGNSGGPLFSLDGRLMGIITAKRQDATGIAFAVPVDHIRGFLHAVTDERARRSGQIGVEVDPARDLDPTVIAQGYAAGLVISAVEAGSPAETAGLRAGDTIVGLRDKRLDGLANSDDPVVLGTHLVATVRSMFAGENLPITVLRDGKVLDLSVVVGAASPTRQGVIDAEELLGLRLDPDASAPIVTAVRDDSPLRPMAQALQGAKIVRLLGEDIDSLSTLAERLDEIRGILRQRQRAARVLIEFRAADGEALPPVHVPVQ